ncbi:hypothetical protein TMatcc_006406 [Talaromyces marneffei ATCC 18224]|uniref:Uncharacterized protein n=1 Tax=Talaromyces marneffei (strain ATCC 18224 / CBS 334.59 / QM 7333) TaxID=441960 RepID=B6QB29_TALMQ|nr:uncharacterized protein EYB26_002652 [Talaromyces marneffei]EEA25370.1 hypothetical protein PMAA_064810 [Talaromyces marneffei ATCC 18224]QGA14996.1 hypothetical protein EYB26_002652 [Talaromyces marneffei]
MALMNNFLILVVGFLLCYTQLCNAAAVRFSNENMQPSTLSTSNDNNNNIINAAHAIDPRAEINRPPTHNEENHAPERGSLETRANIMPDVARILPFLNAFGNIGYSGHKEGGKPPVPE